MNDTKIGSAEWNDQMFETHSTPYNGIAGYIEKKRIHKIFDACRPHFKNGVTVLEVGCESGNLIKYFADKLVPEYQANIIGTDISNNALKIAEGRLKGNAKLYFQDITSDGPKPPLPAIDILICSEVLEHIPNYEKAIAELYSLTNPNTFVVITVPLEKHKNNIKSFLTKIGVFNLFFKGIEKAMSEWHVNDFTRESISEALGKHFDIINYSLLIGLHQVITLKPKKK